MRIEDERAKLMQEILRVSAKGITKVELERRYRKMSRQQIRNITAELTDKGFLSYLEGGRYITTDEGYKFLNSLDLVTGSVQNRSSTLSNKEMNDLLSRENCDKKTE